MRIKTIFLVMGLVCSSLCSAEVLTGVVVKVADGDTITVKDDWGHKQKVRLLGIDAPESDMPYGAICKHNLEDYVLNQTVSVVYEKRDQYNRILGTVILNGGNVNLQQLKDGCAWFYKNYARQVPKHARDIYEETHYDAKYDKRGLWKEERPLEPWEYRKMKRQEADERQSQTRESIEKKWNAIKDYFANAKED